MDLTRPEPSQVKFLNPVAGYGEELFPVDVERYRD
jgi:hypothetical protein